MDSKFVDALTGERIITLEEVKQWTAKYPYFVVPQLSALENNVEMSPKERQKMLAAVAVRVGDREELASIIGEDLPDFAEFYPDSQQTMTTTSVIDSFLDTFAPVGSKETELLSKVLFSDTPDYASQFLKESADEVAASDEAEMTEEERMIERFIAKDKEKSPLAKDSSEKDVKPKSEKLTNKEEIAETVLQEPDNSSLTESFARVMIKNGNYRKALQIITELSLNNPEKSIYFADQIRFLKKLIINENN